MNKIENGVVEIYSTKEEVVISFYDWDSSCSVPFAKAIISPEEFSRALGRSTGKCIIELGRLSIVGKRMQHKTFEFKFQTENNNFLNFKTKKALAIKQVCDKCPKGWEPDCYFNSSDSFFYKENEEGKQELWAKTIIRRWV